MNALTESVKGRAELMSPIRLCNESRCPNPVRPGASKCDLHARQYERERSRRRRGGLKRDPYYIAHRDDLPPAA